MRGFRQYQFGPFIWAACCAAGYECRMDVRRDPAEIGQMSGATACGF